MDIDTIEPGTNFVEALQQAIESCEVLIVLIGKHWLNSTDDTGRRRLDDPKDFVRLEITTALDRHIRVIPILVQGATMPRQEELPDPLRGLARQQSLELSDARWSYDMQLLIRALRERGADRAVRKLSSKLRQAWGIVAKPLVATFLILITLIIPNGLVIGILLYRVALYYLQGGSPEFIITAPSVFIQLVALQALLVSAYSYVWAIILYPKIRHWMTEPKPAAQSKAQVSSDSG